MDQEIKNIVLLNQILDIYEINVFVIKDWENVMDCKYKDQF
jgi:hypothetical protein